MRSILQRYFESIDEWDIWRAYKDWGLMVVPFTGQLLGAADLDAFVFTIKTILPDDAKLVMVGGCGIQVSALSSESWMVFASKQWARVAEGESIPRLHPVELRQAPAPSFWDGIIPKRIREYIKGVALARSAGHGWRYSFYCGRAFRFLSTWRHTIQ